MRFERDSDDLADEAEDVLGVTFAVGIIDDARAGIGRDAVLVDDPFEGRAVAEAVVKCGGGNAAEFEEVVVGGLGLVFGEPHALDAEGDFGFRVFELFERITGLLLVVGTEFHQALPGGDEGVGVGWKRDAWQFCFSLLYCSESGGSVWHGLKSA